MKSNQEKHEYVAIFQATKGKVREECRTIIISRNIFPNEKYCLATIKSQNPDYKDIVITGIYKL